MIKNNSPDDRRDGLIWERYPAHIPAESIAITQNSPPFTLQYFAPDADIADYISTFYIAHIHRPPFDEYERADRPQFRFMSAPNGSYIFGDTHECPAARVSIIGPTSCKVRAVQLSPTAIFGFGLLPAGWAALMGDDANKLTDHAVDAADIFGPWISAVADEIQSSESDEQRLTLGNNLVRELLLHAERAPMWFIRLVDDWLTSSPSPHIPDLVARAQMSLRSIERMTKIYYGLSPRMLARKYRAVRAANILARGESLESTDLANAFYDQSHLIREIKHFAGATPGQLQRPTQYVEATAKGRKSLAGKVLPIVSET
jgi:AraC-like DNA-binding protein